MRYSPCAYGENTYTEKTYLEEAEGAKRYVCCGKTAGETPPSCMKRDPLTRVWAAP